MTAPLWPIPALLWAVVFLVLMWRDLLIDWRQGEFSRPDHAFGVFAWLLAPLAFSALGRFLP